MNVHKLAQNLFFGVEMSPYGTFSGVFGVFFHSSTQNLISSRQFGIGVSRACLRTVSCTPADKGGAAGAGHSLLLFVSTDTLTWWT